MAFGDRGKLIAFDVRIKPSYVAFVFVFTRTKSYRRLSNAGSLNRTKLISHAGLIHTRLARLLTIFPLLIISPGSLLVDFYLKFLRSVSNPVQLLLNVLKTGFIGGIPVNKRPIRLYNATGIRPGGSQACTRDVFEPPTETGSEHFTCQHGGLSQISNLVFSTSEKILNNINVVM